MSEDLRVVIVGGQHVGFHAAKQLDDHGHDVTIIEKDERRAEYLSDQYVATVIQGDGGRPGVLRQADLDRADAVAALTGYGAMTNVGICAVARTIDSEVNTVARIDHGETEEYDDVVDAVVYPERLAAYEATNEILNVTSGGVRTLEQGAPGLELLEVTVAEDAPAAGKRLADVSFPRGAVVIADYESQTVGPDMELRAGYRYLVGVQSGVSDETIRLLRG
ncbi:MAG: TrkA family potassium uptake protein [Halolamina sp.]